MAGLASSLVVCVVVDEWVRFFAVRCVIGDAVSLLSAVWRGVLFGGCGDGLVMGWSAYLAAHFGALLVWGWRSGQPSVCPSDGS